VSPYSIEYPLKDLVDYNVTQSGYGDAQGMNASQELYEDLDALYGGIDPNTLWLMRLNAELPRKWLANDLQVGASMSQSVVTRYFEAGKTVGTPPECPQVPACPDPPDDGDDAWSGIPGSNNAAGGGGGCSIDGRAGSSALLGGLALAAGLALARRRRSKGERA
jgi:hypothetical protein